MMIEKAVILAGGRGTRLLPATRVTNKHLLPIYDRPMIFYPLDTLLKSGIQDILIVCGEEHAGDFAKLLGDGAEFGARFTFKIQRGSGGIAEALGLAEDFATGKSLAVILGDNIFEDDFSEAARRFENGAHIFVKEVSDPERFGVAEIINGKVLSLEEKPNHPKSNMAVTGLYLFDATVFDKIRKCVPSARDELEITDVEKMFLKTGGLSATPIAGNWTDAGTHESFFRASTLAREMIIGKSRS